MRAQIDISFWSDESRWPYDPPGYVFLLRAVNEMGRAMYPNIWTNLEPGFLPLSNFPDWAREPDKALLIHHSEMQRRAQHSAIGQTGRLLVELICAAQMEASLERFDKEAARAEAVAKRLQAVASQIVGWLTAGKLIAALRFQRGGGIGEPLMAAIWQTENWGPRFFRGQMNPNEPFSSK